MFVIELTYKVSLSRIDAQMGAHVAFLKKYYASGNFLVSGRQIPREGGIVWLLPRVDGSSRPSSRKIRSSSLALLIFAS